MKIFNFFVVVLVAMIGLNSCSEDCDHDFIEYDYTKDLVGTWSVIGPDAVEALVIKADGTMEFTGVHDGEFFESTARYELSNNRMRMIWDDGTVDEGRLNVVDGASFSLVIDEGTGAGFYFKYCHEDYSDKLVGSWLIQSDETSEIWTYHENGTADCVSYYYNTEEPYESFLSGTYKLVGDILCETYNYYEDISLTFGSRMSITPDGSPFGDVLTNTQLYMYEDEVEESVMTSVRVKPSLDLMGKKYDYTECHVTCVNGDDIDVQFMDYTFNFAKMDGSGLNAMLKAILFNIEFPNANQLDYAYGETAFNVPISVDSNKLTVKMSEKEPALKDVVFYTFQSEDDNQLHLCMDKTSFVNFYTNMQVMLMQATDEQFDISDTDAVNAIYNKINNAVETIKLNIVMTKVAE